MSYRISNWECRGLHTEPILVSDILHGLPLIVRVKVGISTSHVALGVPLHLCVSVHLATGAKTRGKSILWIDKLSKTQSVGPTESSLLTLKGLAPPLLLVFVFFASGKDVHTDQDSRIYKKRQ